MKIIVGLGNPGPRYEITRHNVGFMVLNVLAEKLNMEFKRQGHFSLISTGLAQREKIILMKPLTYMNLSGKAVFSVINYYKIARADLLIIYDDLDLEVGRVRIKSGGGSGGHKGMGSIISYLSDEHLSRIKVGIGRPDKEGATDYVLMPFPDRDWELVKPAIDHAADAAEFWIKEGIDHTMNQFNGTEP